MSGKLRTLRPWLLLIPLLLGVWWLAGSVSLDPGPSTLSARASGWLLAQRYLEARGTPTVTTTEPLGVEDDALAAPSAPTPSTEATTPGPWVLAFPWQQPVAEGELIALDNHLRAGGTVLVGFSGLGNTRSQEAVLDHLGLTLVEWGGPPPWWPEAWWRYRRQGLTLESPTGRPPLTIGSDLAWVPSAPPKADVLFSVRHPEDDASAPVVFRYPRHRGQVMVFPAEVLANGRLGSEADRRGHGDFLESLRTGLPEPWRFDEFHHGLATVVSVDAARSRRSWDLFAAHLVLLYGLGLWALVRRFGPVYPAQRTRSGTTVSFLEALGALHHRLGHHQEAARQLVTRARQVDPRLPEDTSLEARAESVRQGRDLVALAQDIAQLQRRRPS